MRPVFRYLPTLPSNIGGKYTLPLLNLKQYSKTVMKILLLPLQTYSPDIQDRTSYFISIFAYGFSSEDLHYISMFLIWIRSLSNFWIFCNNYIDIIEKLGFLLFVNHYEIYIQINEFKLNPNDTLLDL